MTLAPRRIWDPLYGLTTLTEAEWALLMLPEVQRLRYVRMCNINSLLIPGASEISRFEHSLGVLTLAKLWARRRGIGPSETHALCAAALLHDVQTGPFGHSLQYVYESNADPFSHEDLQSASATNYHQSTRAGGAFAGAPFGAPDLLGSAHSAVTDYIRGQGKYGPLISSELDLDNIDNVFRLAFHAGLLETHKETPLALAAALDIQAGELTIPEAMVGKVHEWQRTRSTLYRFLLEDWGEFSAKAMLTWCVEQAAEHAGLGLHDWRLTDDELIQHLESLAPSQWPSASDVVRRLRRGRLYHPVAMLWTDDISAYSVVSKAATKRSIEHRIGSRRNSLIVHFILDHAKTSRSVSLRIRETGERRVIGNSSKRLLIGLFSSSEAPPHASLLAGRLAGLLREYGISDPAPLEDPMPGHRSTQLELL